MTNNIVTKYKIVKEAGTIFSSALTTDYIELNNYKYVDFIVSSGAGTAGNTTVSILAKKGSDGTPKAVGFREKKGACDYEFVSPVGKTLSIGGTAGSCGVGVYRLCADELALGELDRVALKTTAVASSTVVGSIIAVAYEPRYAQE